MAHKEFSVNIQGVVWAENIDEALISLGYHLDPRMDSDEPVEVNALIEPTGRVGE